MRFILIVIIFLIGWARATTPAYYLHHERSTQAAVEADCQNRELCLDRTNLAPLGRFNDGTLWHGVTQEKPNVNLTGTLTVTGTTVLSNNLTLSLFATGRIPYTTTAGLLTSGTGLTYDGTTFNVTGIAAISGNATIGGTLGVTGVSTFTAAPVFSSATASLPMFTNGSKALVSNAITGSGNVVMSASPTITTPTISSPTITGTIAGASETLSGTLAVTGATSLNAQTIMLGPSSTTSRPLLLQTGKVSGGANNDYVDVLFRGINTGASAIDGGSIRCTFTDVTARNAKIGIYGSLAEVQTLGLEVASNGAVTLTGGLTSSAGGGYEEGTFTISISGFSAATVGTFSVNTITGTASFVKVGKMVTLFIPTLYGTSNSTSMTIGGIPTTIQPVSIQAVSIPSVEDAGNFYSGEIDFQNGSTANVYFKPTAITLQTGTFTASSEKGFRLFNSGGGAKFVVSYTTF